MFRRSVLALVLAAVWVLGCADSEPTAVTVCGEAACEEVTEAYISHYPNADCTGQESYFTGYFNYDGVRRSWDGKGIVGTQLRTLTHRSWKMNDGGGDGTGCRVNAWPNGNELPHFVHVYR